MLGRGFSPRCKLVRDLLNLARDRTKFERIAGLHGCERRSLAPPTVKQLPTRGQSVTVMGVSGLGDLQQATGKTSAATAACVAHCSRESFGASSWVAALAGFEAVAGDAAGSCCFLVVFSDVHAFEYREGCGSDAPQLNEHVLMSQLDDAAKRAIRLTTILGATPTAAPRITDEIRLRFPVAPPTIGIGSSPGERHHADPALPLKSLREQCPFETGIERLGRESPRPVVERATR